MDLKKATLLAFIGGILMLPTSIIWMTGTYSYFGKNGVLLTEIMKIIGEIFIVIFFYSLYKKQK